MKVDFKLILHTLLPILVIAAINFVYFYPVFEGKILDQDDIIMGLAKNKETMDYREANNDEPLWTNAMFSGMPTFQMSTIYPNNIYKKIENGLGFLLGRSSSIYIIAFLMIGFYILLRTLKVDPWLSLAGAVAFGFSAFFIISHSAGHNAKVRTAAYIPMVLAAILMAYNGRRWLGMALTALFLGMSIASNHFQITYYMAFLIAAVVVVYFVKSLKNNTIPSFAKSTAMLAIGAIVAVGPNIGNMWSTYGYTQETMRGGQSELSQKAESKGGLSFEYAMQWSYGPTETLNLFIPNLMGGGAKQSFPDSKTHAQIVQSLQGQGVPKKRADEMASQYVGNILYWGDQSLVNGGYYVGASVIFLFLFGLLVMSGTMRSWIIAALVLSLFMAWGRHFSSFNELMFSYFPLFNKFRVPSMALVIAFTLIPLAAIVGVQKVFSGELSRDLIKKKLLLSLYITGGLALFFAVLGPVFLSFEGANDARMVEQGFDINTMIDDRTSIMRSSAFRSLIFVALAFGLMFYFNSKKIKPLYAGLALTALFMIDLWPFDKEQLGEKDFITQREFNKRFAPTEADQTILADSDIHYRVFNTTASISSDSYTSYHHKSVGGYHGAKLNRYQDLIERQLGPGSRNVFDMLNTKWFILQDENRRIFAQENTNNLGDGWFVNEILWVKNADEEIDTLNGIDLKRTVAIDTRFKDYVGNPNLNPGSSKIELESYDPKHMVYSADVKGGTQFAVFSEIYYEGWDNDWKAYLNGEPVEHIRVNYLLRGMLLPEGKHTLEFKFEPVTYFMGNKIDLGASIVFLLLFGAALWFDSKSKKLDAPTTEA